MDRFKVYHGMRFDKWIHICNHQPYQNTEHHLSPAGSLVLRSSQSTPPSTEATASVTVD